MKSFVIALCIFACACASNVDQTAQVLRSDYEQNPEGGFQYGYETENGISGQATGEVKSLGKDESALTITGSNSFQSPEGNVYSISYVADENGYRAVGDHLPTPPAPLEIPAYVLRAIEYIKAHPYQEKEQ